jgi:hypothetical protein
MFEHTPSGLETWQLFGLGNFLASATFWPEQWILFENVLQV